MPMRSGCGARRCLDSCRNFSFETGENFLICDQRLLPVTGNVSGVGNVFDFEDTLSIVIFIRPI